MLCSPHRLKPCSWSFATSGVTDDDVFWKPGVCQNLCCSPKARDELILQHGKALERNEH
jgi:hypothetical protein